MNWLHDPDKDEYFSRVDDEVRSVEHRFLGGGLAVGVALALLITLMGVGCIIASVILWQELFG
jgi:hypothetical protein